MKITIATALAVVILIFCVIIVKQIKRILEMSKKSNIVNADMRSFFKLSGRPTRYIIEVEFELNSEKKEKKVTIIDSRAERLIHEKHIPIVYCEKSNRVYWADESRVNRILLLIYLVVVEILLLFVFFVVLFTIR